MTSVGYVVPPNYTAGSNTSQAASKNQNPNDPNMLTTGAYGNAFELALNSATVSGGEMLVQAGGPIRFVGISAYQNGFVDSIITDLTSQLQHDSMA